MKNKRAFIVIVLIVAVLLLAVGYAAITTNLTITGSASAGPDSSNFKVAFNGTTSTSGAGTITASATAESTAASLTVTGLTTTGQTATGVFTIENYSTELGASLAVETALASGITSNSDYFEITACTLANNTLAAGATTTVTVTVRLKKTPVANVTGNISLTLSATATEV